MFKKNNTFLFWTILAIILLIGGSVFTITKAAKFEIPYLKNAKMPGVMNETATVALTNQSQTMRGIEIELSNVRLSNKSITGVVCYELSTDADWLIDEVKLTVDDKVFTDYRSSLIDWRYSDKGTKTHRCNDLILPFSSKGEISIITITIGRLVTSIPEWPDCVKAQEKLDANQTGIVISCEHGPGYFDFDILQMPESISEITAVETIRDALHDEIIEGPWVFRIPIIP